MLGQSIELWTETLSNVFLDFFQFAMAVIQTRQYCKAIIKNKCVSMQDYLIMLTCTIAGHIKNSNFQDLFGSTLSDQLSQKNAYLAHCLQPQRKSWHDAVSFQYNRTMFVLHGHQNKPATCRLNQEQLAWCLSVNSLRPVYTFLFGSKPQLQLGNCALFTQQKRLCFYLNLNCTSADAPVVSGFREAQQSNGKEKWN